MKAQKFIMTLAVERRLQSQQTEEKRGQTQSHSRDNPKHDRRRISSMNSSTTDKVKGTAKEVAGKVKEETGKAVGNPNLEDRGTTEKIAGKVERKVGDVKKVFGK
jgi:uncharacterized protein YjbJ (UPF0337 family)